MSDIIEINGKDIPCRFAFSAIRKFMAETGVSLEDFGKEFGLDKVQSMAKHGFNCARQLIGEKELNDQEVEKILDSDFKSMTKVLEKFTEDVKKLFPESEQQGNPTGEAQLIPEASGNG